MKLFLYLFNFRPKKAKRVYVQLLLLILYVVAHPIGDGLQPSRHGLHEVHQAPHPLKSCSKHDFTDMFVIIYIKALEFSILLPSLIKML
jgi:hypothetical protein